VDDLPEVFEAGFPQGVQRVLYDRAGDQILPPGVERCRSWEEVRRLLLDAQATR
jgi:hypothetical protein